MYLPIVLYLFQCTGRWPCLLQIQPLNECMTRPVPMYREVTMFVTDSATQWMHDKTCSNVQCRWPCLLQIQPLNECMTRPVPMYREVTMFVTDSATQWMHDKTCSNVQGGDHVCYRFIHSMNAWQDLFQCTGRWPCLLQIQPLNECMTRPVPMYREVTMFVTDSATQWMHDKTCSNVQGRWPCLLQIQPLNECMTRPVPMYSVGDHVCYRFSHSMNAWQDLFQCTGEVTMFVTDSATQWMHDKTCSNVQGGDHVCYRFSHSMNAWQDLFQCTGEVTMFVTDSATQWMHDKTCSNVQGGDHVCYRFSHSMNAWQDLFQCTGRWPCLLQIQPLNECMTRPVPMYREVTMFVTDSATQWMHDKTCSNVQGGDHVCYRFSHSMTAWQDLFQCTGRWPCLLQIQPLNECMTRPVPMYRVGDHVCYRFSHSMNAWQDLFQCTGRWPCLLQIQPLNDCMTRPVPMYREVTMFVTDSATQWMHDKTCSNVQGGDHVCYRFSHSMTAWQDLFQCTGRWPCLLQIQPLNECMTRPVPMYRVGDHVCYRFSHSMNAWQDLFQCTGRWPCLLQIQPLNECMTRPVPMYREVTMFVTDSATQWMHDKTCSVVYS